MRRILAVSGSVALLATGALAGAMPAAAVDSFAFEMGRDWTLMPGEGRAELRPDSWYNEADGTLVYALSKKQLNDPAWAAGGVPAGLAVSLESGCKAAATAGVYLCDAHGDISYPEVSATATAAHGTTAYLGLAYAPSGTNVDKAVKEAQTAATYSEDGLHAARTITVKSAEHVAQNTLALNTPTLKAGDSVTQSITVHAVDAGHLSIMFGPSEGQRGWEESEADIRIDSVSRGDNTTCDHTLGSVAYGGEVRCDITPGDVTIDYTLTAGAKMAAWKVDASAVYEVYNWGTHNPETSSHFVIDSPYPVRPHHLLLARGKDGLLRYHHGTGSASQPFRDYEEIVGHGWNIYNQLTKLAPVTVQAGGGGLVGRDTSGVLWHYRTSGDWNTLAGRTKVGAGWNVYNKLAGVTDLTGDGRADLLARDTSGVLWLYKGTGTNTAPFAVRTRVGGGWGGYNELTGSGDVTGDGRADLLARDTSGVLWLYKGTGTAASPFAARTRVGGGWSAYRSMSSPGDLTDDGRADLVVQDTSGVLWLYRATGSATAPYAARVKVTGAGDTSTISGYNTLL
ncbi:VCBS repeat-containing protein [Streptomyces sp. P01-B04]|uniref:FG-GAP repeat domain-containing protein n=1 Tax=Streptomyces poriferorum TaxID=2798799 RepID=UPI001C5FF4FA|nr:VCBS repeat-containing protein [Streptomyces poriferorum]MBW5250386.1 VCBS repeat-containing protein [Streptomyces poriferorum]MBW5261165.1 VCBS repeat-containing protein [Streptomyces poriferorum]